MSKYDMRSLFECQGRILNVKIRKSALVLNVKIGFRMSNEMSKYDIPPQFECQNRMLNIKIRYSVRYRISKYYFSMSKYNIWLDFECQNRILNVKIRYWAQV